MPGPLYVRVKECGRSRRRKSGRDLDIAEVLALVTGVARAGSPAQGDRFLTVLLEGITPRLFAVPTR